MVRISSILLALKSCDILFLASWITIHFHISFQFEPKSSSQCVQILISLSRDCATSIQTPPPEAVSFLGTPSSDLGWSVLGAAAIWGAAAKLI